MPRPERPLDLASGPVTEFAAGLRRLRERAGSPGYRELARQAHFSAATLSAAAAGRRLPTLAVTLAYAEACGGDRDEWEARWRAVAAQPGEPESTDGVRAPYQGLAPYGPEDSLWFFGRDRLISELGDRLRHQRFLAVFGPSGSGKSSLLRAGLLPRLSNGASGSTILMTPGSHPFRELAIQLGRLAGVPAGLLLDDLTADPARMHLAVRQALPSGLAEAELVLVVDQFEEIFTLCRDAGERAGFVAALVAAAQTAESRTRVVLGVRADFYARCAELPDLVAALRDAQLLVGAMTPAELREAVVRPAERAGAMVEGALVSTVVSEVTGRPGALPLASHALLEAWHRRRGNAITLSGYEAAGGVAAAIAQTAERVYHDLDQRQRQAARQALLRMIQVGEDGDVTRRRVERSELTGGDPDATAVLERLAGARLLTVGERTVEVAHEALLRGWTRLRDWLEEDLEGLRIHRQLTEAAAVWDSLNREHGALYRGIRLSRTAQWASDSHPALIPIERDYLDASLDADRREATARRRRGRLAVGGLSCAVAIVSLLAAVALIQADRAAAERDLATSRQLAANAREQLQVDHETALLLAMAAYDTRPTAEAQATLRQAVADSRVRATVAAGQGEVVGVAYRPDGRQLASTGSDGTVRLWQRTGPNGLSATPRLLRERRGKLWSPVFSPDGRWLAASGVTGAVTVWDLSTDAAPVLLRGHRTGVLSVAFSPDGRRLASASKDGTVRVWQWPSRRLVRTLRLGDPPPNGQYSQNGLAVAFAPDGRYLAAGGDGPILVWDTASWTRRQVLIGHEGSVKDIAFSPDGRRLASAGLDGTVRIWATAGDAAPLVLRAADGNVESVAFSPDGRRLASTYSGSNAIRVWNATSDDAPLLMRGHDGVVWSVAFSPDGQRLATGSSDGTIQVWDPGYPGDAVVLSGHKGPVWSVAVSGDGRRIASGGVDGAVRVWQYPRWRDPLVLRGHVGEILGVALTRDGRWAASAGRDGTVRIWDTTAGVAKTVLPHGHNDAVYGVDFSPDGRRLASAGQDGTVRIWDTAGHDPPVVLRGHQGRVRGVAFSPDGRHVASSGADGTVRIWDATGHDPPIVLNVLPFDQVWAVAFSPDGRKLAASGHDGGLQVWNSNGHGQPLVLGSDRDTVWSVAFSPDGQTLASSGEDGHGLRIWQTSTGKELVTYHGHTASTEQVRFAPDGHRLITSHGDGTVRLWACEVCGPIEQVRALANTRATRPLTPYERNTFLP